MGRAACRGGGRGKFGVKGSMEWRLSECENGECESEKCAVCRVRFLTFVFIVKLV